MGKTILLSLFYLTDLFLLRNGKSEQQNIGHTARNEDIKSKELSIRENCLVLGVSDCVLLRIFDTTKLIVYPPESEDSPNIYEK